MPRSAVKAISQLLRNSSSRGSIVSRLHSVDLDVLLAETGVTKWLTIVRFSAQPTLLVVLGAFTFPFRSRLLPRPALLTPATV